MVCQTTLLLTAFFGVGSLYGVVGSALYLYIKKHREEIKMFGKNKKEKKAKNQTREFVNGVPQKVPELDVPTPQPGQAVPEQPRDAQEVYNEGRSVGFQEGIIYSTQALQDILRQYQAQLKANIQQQPTQVIPPPPAEPTPRSGLYEIRLCEGCGSKNEVHKKKKAFVCDNCGDAST